MTQLLHFAAAHGMTKPCLRSGKGLPPWGGAKGTGSPISCGTTREYRRQRRRSLDPEPLLGPDPVTEKSSGRTAEACGPIAHDETDVDR
jgi:hypothetical protein